MQPGNSGGPLLDASRHVAGIVTSKLNAENVARFIGTPKAWPYPVVEFNLGKRSAEHMATAAPGAEDRCGAQFYVGEWRLVRGDRMKAKEALEAAKATCPQSFYEYDGAVAELGRRRQGSMPRGYIHSTR